MPQGKVFASADWRYWGFTRFEHGTEEILKRLTVLLGKTVVPIGAIPTIGELYFFEDPKATEPI